MTKSKTKPVLALAILPVLVIGICLVAPGCGGGANSNTTVTLKPAELTDSETPDGQDPTKPVKPGATGEPGSLVGKFTFNGTAPSLAPLVNEGAAVANAEFCSAKDVPNQSLVVGPGGGIANVYIYLDEAPKGFQQSEELEPVVIDQKFCTFKPHGQVLQTGQTLLVKNDDGAPHNTNVGTVRNSNFNPVVSANDREGASHVYEKPEKTPSRVKCEFHAWMSASLLIVDHPFAACSKEDGTFEIKNLPPGKHTFRVWHESGDILERSLKVEIKPGEPSTVEKSYGIEKFPKL